MRVFVLLFNAGTDNEGIHTLRMGDRNVVLMFEDEDDATRYGLMLEAQELPAPSVQEFEEEDIEEFCEEVDYECRIVPSGTLEIPPEATIQSEDWDPDAPADAPQTPAEPAEFSQAELDRIRQKLEGLL
ncbi:MAG: DUF3110 domain-containing protein [Synechococcales bacterium]|nr:DUF3110 domain-containing protein [Synechococcales bacterium]